MITIRLIQIPDLEYEEFYQIRREIMLKAPWALLNSDYFREDKIGYFHFWDSDYIPDELRKFKVDPPNLPEYDFSEILSNINLD